MEWAKRIQHIKKPHAANVGGCEGNDLESLLHAFHFALFFGFCFGSGLTLRKEDTAA
jgi:hypothetical protein